ncbi:glutamate racemase [Vibrio sp. SS-MA-C1-2]|uniref:glutamate racemase n=1 Tax=Vibrio sp. SS-MA-C1-2 TaxID=2908646 RepID=UPI001F213F02|nr:glutamate racemase [Vibrio sp. SS-MA-C1-2]UJF19460.1 glutamate racemase [Vibrio sp. SS-MA-C1-2]
MKTILIFDSGVGGISIYKEIYKLLPEQNYIYAFDNGAFPYGELSDQTLIERTIHIIEQVKSKHIIDIIVIACNTASTIVLPHLRALNNIPVVGVVPAIKPAAAISKMKVIGLLATPATIKRQYTHQLVENFAADCQIKMIGSTRLVEMAEDKIKGHEVDMIELESIIAPWLGRVDSVVLGCTHFPLIKTELNCAFNHRVYLIDSGKAVANRVESLLKDNVDSGCLELLNADKKRKEVGRVYSSVAINNEATLLNYLITEGLSEIRSLDYRLSSDH